MEEIERIKEKIIMYQNAAAKLDSLDEKTKAIVLASLKNSINEFILDIKRIENNYAKMDMDPPTK